MPDEAASHLRNIRGLLSRAMLKDRAATGRRLEIIFQKKARVREPAGLTRDLAELESRLEASCRERIRRERERPPLRFPGELPITALRREIVRAIKSEPVVIISGETGCGKSTQIPKMCLEAGRGVAGRIACTQPRRIAAITIAHRIAEELGETLGRSVGYKIRFRDRSPREAYIKIMTDGMLLAETQSGPRLYDYDTIIIDEAHERSVNIDFLLGIAKNLLVVRPELRVIITSATLDTEKFSRSFHGAPVIHVGGRLYPVEVEYRPAEAIPRKPGDGDYVDMAVHAAEKIQTRRRGGDVLIFMPTEQDILETCDRLEGKKFAGTTVLPLFARLPGAQQGRVYSVKGPKIVVATNVAETSLTIPGIKYVIDTGLARISQYQPGTRINSLPVSPVSRSSADQRMGRCGRVQEGHCIRLYSREDYESRPQFTPPEIQRSNLAEVILRMIDLHLGHPSEFPFVDPPPQKTIKDGYETLLELGAVSGEGREYELTPLGRRMARMPLDPKVSRMLLEAEKEGCLREVAVIASGLSIRDPRERPPADTARADARHAVFKHPSSDFLTLLNIWDRFHGPEEMSATRSRQRKFCEENYLSFSRMREWQFIHDQIVSILEEQKVVPGRGDGVEISAELYGAVHRSILSGFLSNIAVHKEKNIYSAAKSREVHVFPGSSLFNQARPWIVSAEVVQTSRLFARIAARIDPAWLEDLGGELCRSSCSEPRWDKEHREVRAKQRVTLFGLEIIKDRDVPFGPVNPGLAHEIFIWSGLLEGDVDHPPPFLRHNLGLVQKISGMEDKLRRRDILVKKDVLAGFYSRRLPGVHDWAGLEKRISQAGGDRFLMMSEQDLLATAPGRGELDRFPDEFSAGGWRLEASYRFAPGEEADGVTVRVPAALIKNIPAEPLEWGMPGQFKDKIGAMIKGLPKKYRKLLMPFSEKTETIAAEMARTDPSLFKSLSRFVKQRFQADIPPAEWAKADLPPHLKIRVSVTDSRGAEVAAGRDIGPLRQSGGSFAAEVDSPDWNKAAKEWKRENITGWDFGTLPESVAVGPYSSAYPGLEAGDGGIRLRLFKARGEAEDSHKKGVEALLRPSFEKDLEFVKRYLVLPDDCRPAALYFGGPAALAGQLASALGREVFRKNIRSREEFDAYSGTVVRRLFEKGHELHQAVSAILEAYGRTSGKIAAIRAANPSNRAVQAICGSIRAEMERLVPGRFLETYPLDKLSHLARYLKALEIRAERAKNDPEKDGKKSAQARPFEEALRRLSENIEPEASLEKRKAADDFRWMVEEFKLSLFAPEVKTLFPTSAKRLIAALKEIEDME